MRRTGMPADAAATIALALLLACAAPCGAAAGTDPAPVAEGAPPPAPAPAEAPATPSRPRLLLPRAAEGTWLRSDRALHFGVSLALAASLRVAGRDRGAAFGLSFGIGVGKEVYDATLKPAREGPRGMSRRDLVADLLGAAAGVLVLDAMDR